ncbi:hypothetical protein GCM10010399_64090 [Dactylosporangium fulvum]|uniref:Uncharacterized protein n=1 Tax=Dactylosporangium fulvum TaxID=53359 RepID=A0ABY5WAQ0_9ACTN|nr:hypothetical protein [Dactylosporangium fulvum]UWP85768.1 hypothetical protein Dfulv_16610 [Dactylosporangium fulvum]
MRTVAGTGHRPATRTNPDGITPAQMPWVRAKCRAGLLWLRDEHGTEEVWSGMALGFDLALAAAAVDLGMPLRAVIPFESQPDVWRDPRDIAEWRRLRAAAASEIVCGPNPTSKQQAVALLHGRNDELLKADGIFACWDARKRAGGTYSAVRKARDRGVPVVHIDPAAQVVCGIGCPRITSIAKPQSEQSSLFDT